MSGNTHRKHANKNRVLNKAPYYDSITSLSEGEGISRKSIYRYFSSDKAYEKSVKKVLGTKMSGITIQDTVRNVGMTDKAKNKTRLRTINPDPSIRSSNEGILKADDILKSMGHSVDKSNTEHSVISSGKEASKRSSKMLANNKVTIEVARIPPKNRTLEQKIYLGFKVCESMEKHVSVTDACLACGIAEATFYRWVNPKNREYIEDVGMRFIEAKDHVKYIDHETLTALAKAALKDGLTERQVTETRTFGTVNKTGKVVPRTVAQTTKTQTPSIAHVRFVLENLAGDFSRKIEDKETDEDLAYTPMEVLDEEYEATLKKLEAAKSQSIEDDLEELSG